VCTLLKAVSGYQQLKYLCLRLCRFRSVGLKTAEGSGRGLIEDTVRVCARRDLGKLRYCSQDELCSGQDLNRELPEYEAGVPITMSRRSGFDTATRVRKCNVNNYVSSARLERCSDV
jgi:hypothetical protein